MVSETISHYKILEKIGAGGMGEVYKAEDTKLRRTVALKFLPPSLSSDPQAKKRFIQEARAASALDHPNICTIHEIGESDDGRSFIAMACYDGQSLKDMIAGATGPVAHTIDQTISIIIQIAKGLARAHEEGIVHRDIKPANIMITSRGEVKILDFGLAKLAGQSRMTKTGSTVGTIAYMSPEQARGDTVDQRTDIWSLGVILYEMLAGNLPFRGDYDQAVIYSILNEDPEPIDGSADIPKELLPILNKALAKDVNQRNQSIEELLQDFQPLSATAVLPAEVSLKQAAVRIWRKNKALTLITAAVVLILVSFWIFKPGWIADQSTGPRKIAVVSFDNLTGGEDTENLASIIPNLLMTGLNQSTRIRVLTWDYLRDKLKQQGIRDVKLIDRELGYQVCQQTNIDALVTGSFAKMGDFYVTDVKVIDPETKEIVVSVSARGEDIRSISERQIDELSQAILEGMNAVDSTFLAEKKPIQEITTHSPQAYRYFLQSRESKHLPKEEHIRLLKRALKLDSTFAAAYLDLSTWYYYSGMPDKEASAIKKAYRYAESASHPDREIIYADYAMVVEKNIEKYGRYLKAALKINPYDKRVWTWYSHYYFEKNNPVEQINCLEKALAIDPEFQIALDRAAYVYARIGNKKKAIENVEKHLVVTNSSPDAIQSAGQVYYILGMLDESQKQFHELKQIKPEWIHSTQFRIIQIQMLRQNYDQVRQELDVYHNEVKSAYPDHLYIVDLYRALFSYYMGEISHAFGEIDDILNDYELSIKWKGRVNEIRCFLLIDQNDFIAASQALKFLLHRPANNQPDMYNVYQAMMYLAQGKLDSCRYYRKQALNYLEKIGHELEFQEPLWMKDVQMKCDLLRAELLLAADSIDQAIEYYREIRFPTILREVASYSLAVMPNLRYNIPLEKDIIPRALIRKGKKERAIEAYEEWVEFQPDQKERFFINPKYHYRLAKLYEQNRQRQKAIKRYKIFLDIWKYADKDLPELIDAKERLASLNMK